MPRSAVRANSSTRTHAGPSKTAVFDKGHSGTQLAGTARASQPAGASPDHQVVERSSGGLGHGAGRSAARKNRFSEEVR